MSLVCSSPLTERRSCDFIKKILWHSKQNAHQRQTSYKVEGIIFYLLYYIIYSKALSFSMDKKVRNT